MIRQRLKTFGKQSGVSLFAMIIILAMLAMFLSVGLRILPAYMDNSVIVNAMEGMAANNDLSTLTVGEVRTNLLRTLTTNGIRNFDANSVQINREGVDEYIDINYETRVPLFYNIEAVVIFNNRFDR